MAGGQWEVVGGGKAKKNKPKAVNKGKKEDKSNGVATFATAGPITESKTVFNAFLEKEKKEQPSKQPKSSESVKGKEKNGPQKKKGDKKNVVTKTTVEELCSNITEEEVKNHMATVKVLVPHSQFLWLKDLTTFFNVKLDINIDPATLTSKPVGYPSSHLKKGVYNNIGKLFNSCTPQALQVFHEYCLNGLVQEGLKGLHILGYCTMLQCLAQEMPSIISSNFSKYAELCNAHSNRQNICLLLWWAAGQVGNKDLEVGFQIWLQLMFPMIGEKNCSPYAIEYIEDLVERAKKSNFKNNIIQVKDFFPILDFIYSKELSKGVQKRLIAVYPTLKTLSYGHDPENTLRNYFPSYLHRLDPQTSQLLKSEILSSLVYCLEKDFRSFSVWRQLYTKHFIQSKLLIAHLNDKWEELPQKFPKKYLRDTLSAFQVTNEELSNSKKNVDVEECSLINKELLLKMSASKISWFRVIASLIFVASLLLTYDIITHNSFAESNVGIFMKDTGLLVVCAQASEKLSYFYGKTKKLFETYSPVFISWYQSTFLPYFELFMKKLASIVSNVWDSTETMRLWCNEKFPPLLELMENKIPNIKENLITVLTNASRLIMNYISFAWTSAESIAMSIQSNALVANYVDSVGEKSLAVFNYLKQYFAFAIESIRSFLSSSEIKT